ncbi:FGGY-family carbohydrate kinase [Pseudovibrio sp. Tun.PSC04-5.I4]|uniref:FGGY-family carbohydrate kinase n=1 Tax=Pseudovibrio sp. Tun.PSC04-5.I4 TaxID=1798213 RepID=UPI00087F0855|nr:FGGY-family carbohydrate kinase [Pseudovibrio sp. Tun.PSC04-5.I4]SDR25169.1 L-xylulokinase [Pseudovibrio sp. Tun.PSC04-5.I4]
MGSYLLGLDAGNTVIKAVLFDLTGRIVSMAGRDGVSSSPTPGHVLRDLEELWSNAASVISKVITDASISPDEIVGVGCAGHGNGLYLLDKQEKPLLAVQSLDTRAIETVERYQTEGKADPLYDLCLQKPWVSQTPTLLRWVKDNAPETYAQIGTVFLCKDFITHKLTGKRVSDISDMSGCGLLNMQSNAYDAELMKLYGLSDAMEFLPELLAPEECAGKITAQAVETTGLAEGTPVVAGLFDVIASALGSGVVKQGEASIVAGTWSINQVITEKPLHDPRVFMASSFGPGKLMEIEASATSAANLEWYVREFIERVNPQLEGAEAFALCNEMVQSVTPSDDLPFVLPFLYGSGPEPRARASFIGIAGWHSQAHLLYALYEGVAFEHRRHIEQLKAAGATFESAILSGGGSRSQIWPQIFADVLNIPLSISDCQETGALGAAIAAGVGAGVFYEFEAGVEAMTNQTRNYAPQADLRNLMDRRYTKFQKLSVRFSIPLEEEELA